MRPISGFERPGVQYLFVGLAVVLIGVGTWNAVAVRRSAREIERLRAADLNARLERDQLEARAAREQSARESLSREIARAGTTANPPDIPTLTLTPSTSHGPLPPPPTVAPPKPTQVIALRLALPRSADKETGPFDIVIRNWSEGQTTWSRSGVPAVHVQGRRFAEAYLTGDVLAAGAYEVLLTAGTSKAVKEIATYQVTVGH